MKDRVSGKQYSERLMPFVLHPQSWDYFYSYIADPVTADEVDEFIHLETVDFKCLLLGPRPYKSRVAKLLVGCEKPERPGEPTIQRPVIGHINIRAKRVDAYVGVPASNLTRLVTVISSGRIALIRIMATRPVNHRSLVRSFTITTYPEVE